MVAAIRNGVWHEGDGEEKDSDGDPAIDEEAAELLREISEAYFYIRVQAGHEEPHGYLEEPHGYLADLDRARANLPATLRMLAESLEDPDVSAAKQGYGS